MSYSRRGRPNRIYRSRKDRVFFGVCGGIAEHFDWNPWAVRFGLIALQLLTWWPIVAYVILGFVLAEAPRRPFAGSEDEEFYNVYRGSRSDALGKAHRTYEAMNKRLQRLESVVTSPSFDIEEEFRNL